MLRVILVLLLYSFSSYCYSQDSTGFYFTISEKEKNCPQRFRTFDEKQSFCAPQKPILDRSVFTNVTEIQFDSQRKRKYIDLYLTPKGLERLKAITSSLPNASLILVVDEKVVGLLKNKDVVGRFIRIDSDLSSRQLDWIHDKLKKGY
jgi:hypothetical protein